MLSIELIRDNLTRSMDRVLKDVIEMREYCLVPPTSNGGGHTLWVLGHLAFIEGLVIHVFMLNDDNPLSHWESIFDGFDVTTEPKQYPPFDQVHYRCCEIRNSTISILNNLSEDDLSKESAKYPKNFSDVFGTYRHCFQYVADHWYMHRGHLADARRSAGLERMWL